MTQPITLEQWEAMRDALAAEWPIGATVETHNALGLDDGIRGVVDGHTARSIEWRDDTGTGWRMSPKELRIVAPQ
jgi:hypothetical protein